MLALTSGRSFDVAPDRATRHRHGTRERRADHAADELESWSDSAFRGKSWRPEDVASDDKSRSREGFRRLFVARAPYLRQDGWRDRVGPPDNSL